MLELSDNRCGNEQIFMKLSSGWTIDFGAFVQQLPYAAFWKDCRCIYQGCNQIFADSVGLASPIAIVGLSDDDLDLPVAQSALFRSLSEDTLAAGATRSCRETPSTPDGVMLERTLNITPVRSPDGVVIGLFGIAITVRATDQPEAGSFYEAVEIAARTLYLDMVILDMVMPGMDGFAGLEIMLKQCPQVPVVIMSGAANSKDMLQAINLGAAGFIPMVPS